MDNNTDTLRTNGDKRVATGETIPEATKKRALELLAKGGGVNTTAEECGMTPRTLMAIRDIEIAENPRFANAYYATRTPAKLLHLANRSMERMETEMERMPLGVLPVVMGVALDKYMALSGQASTVIEHRHTLSMTDASSPGQVIDI